jgi:hypothetical protein
VISSPDKVYGAEYDGPWIMTFDNFLDDFEIKQLLHGASYGEGFIRSTDQGRVNPETGEMVKVTSQTRTSSNAWCRADCEALPGVKRVTDQIEEVCVCLRHICALTYVEWILTSYTLISISPYVGDRHTTE